MDKTFVCCLCHETFEGYGNNPYPVITDEGASCCDVCNRTIVVKTRNENFREKLKKRRNS
jgi:hypothetical protein